MKQTILHLKFIPLFLAISAVNLTAIAEISTPVSPVSEIQEQSEARLEWFKKAKFGLFIHWGLYSVAGGYWSEDGTFDSRFDGNPENDKGFKGYTEWIFKSADMPMAEYSRMAGIFDWRKFNAQDYIDLCFASGQKYIVITAKHHDGFAMYHSKYSDYNIVDKTPTGQKTGRDPLKELADACHATKTNGSPWEIKMCFYYSHDDDWHDEHINSATPDRFQKFLDGKVKTQVKELLTNYGEIGLIWYDLPNSISPKQAADLMEYTRSISPKTIVNSRIGGGLGDYATTGDNGFLPTRVDFVWEACGTINHTWGFRINDEAWKGNDFLLQRYVQAVSRNGNFLLNIGPRPDGSIPEGSVKALKAMGDWIKTRQEAYFDIEPSPYVGEYLFSHDWGECTTKGNKLFLHVDQWPENHCLDVPLLLSKVKRVNYLVDDNKKSLPFETAVDARGNNVVRISVPDTAPETIITVIEIEVEGNDIKLHPYKNPYDPATKKLSLSLQNFQFDGPSRKMTYGKDSRIIKTWRTSKWSDFHFDSAIWHIDVPEAGNWKVELEYAMDDKNAGGEIGLYSDGNLMGTFLTVTTGGMNTYVTREVATVKLKKGKQVFDITPLCNKEKTQAMNLKGVTLTRVD